MTCRQLRSCGPDGVVLKRLVLSGYLVRVHKGKAVSCYCQAER